MKFLLNFVAAKRTANSLEEGEKFGARITWTSREDERLAMLGKGEQVSGTRTIRFGVATITNPLWVLCLSAFLRPLRFSQVDWALLTIEFG